MAILLILKILNKCKKTTLLFFNKDYNIYMNFIEKKNDAILDIPILKDWNNKDPDEKQYSFKDLTDCYLLAKEHGKKESKKELEKNLKETFIKDAKNVQQIGADFYKFVIKNGIEINQLRLKIISFSEFKLLFIISKKSFLNDKFDEVLDESYKITDSNNIDISFMPYNKFLNIDKLLSDGFTITYGK